MAEDSANSFVAGVTLSADPTSAALARAFVDAKLRRSKAEQLTEEAVLLTSELVSNVIRHVHTRMTVTIALEEQSLRVTVCDPTNDPPVRREPRLSDISGRGLQLVDAVAASWGVDRSTRGKAVWFELVMAVTPTTSNMRTSPPDGVAPITVPRETDLTTAAT